MNRFWSTKWYKSCHIILEVSCSTEQVWRENSSYYPQASDILCGERQNTGWQTVGKFYQTSQVHPNLCNVGFIKDAELGNCLYCTCMASSISGQDESNYMLWLATWVGKMELSCPLGTTHCILQEKFPWKPYDTSFIDQACSVKMAGYWPCSFLVRL